MKIGEMRTLVKWSKLVQKIIIGGEPGFWCITVLSGESCYSDSLEKARGEIRFFKTMDAAFAVAKELDDLHNEAFAKRVPLEIWPD